MLGKQKSSSKLMDGIKTHDEQLAKINKARNMAGSGGEHLCRGGGTLKKMV